MAGVSDAFRGGTPAPNRGALAGTVYVLRERGGVTRLDAPSRTVSCSGAMARYRLRDRIVAVAGEP